MHPSTQAIAGLNGMQIGDKKLVVQRASVGAKGGVIMDQAIQAGLAQPIIIPGLNVAGTMQEATEVLCLMNMVTEEELMDDEEYEGGWCLLLFIEYLKRWGCYYL